MPIEYCFKILKKKDNIKNLKSFLTKQYESLGDKLKFIIVYDKPNHALCIEFSTRSKTKIKEIEDLHLTKKFLKALSNKLSPPQLFALKVPIVCKLDGKKWNTLKHNGPYFHEPYVKIDATVRYKGKKLHLSPKEEQVLGFWALRLLSERKGGVTEFQTKDKTFRKNYFKDLKTYLSSKNKKIVKNLNDLDFSVFVDQLGEIKDIEPTKWGKNNNKIKKAEIKKEYGYAIVDGHMEKVGNSNVELPGLFMGRGDNPKRGKIKPDIKPSDVTINCSQCPKPPYGKWKKVVTDKNGIWLAKWTDPMTKKIKYINFSQEGKFKGSCDLEKYEKARKLNKYLKKVREKYLKDGEKRDIKSKELGAVLYLIDNYGIRVGNEKKKDEANTVGASTLRVEHIKFLPPNTIIFDFLGKDSVRYIKKIKVPPTIYKNFKLFVKDKKKNAKLFSHINSTAINDYLHTFDKNFSAKVFRTRLASDIMAKGLEKLKIPKSANKTQIKGYFNKANVKVAEVLNHTRTISKKNKESLDKLKKELTKLKKEYKNESNEKKKEKLKAKVQKKKEQIERKKDVLNVAVSTSLNNYIDPRLVVAWAKKRDIDTSAIYTATLQRKFKWAIDSTPKNFDYHKSDLVCEQKLEPQKKSKTKSKSKSQSRSRSKTRIRSRSKTRVKSKSKTRVRSRSRSKTRVSSKSRIRSPTRKKKLVNKYIEFAKVMRPKLKKKHPDLTFGQLSKLLSKEWAKHKTK